MTIGHTPASSAENKMDYWYKEPTLGLGEGDIRVHLAQGPMRRTLVSTEPMRSSIRNVSHPAEQEMMKLPAQVCGECVMWQTETQLRYERLLRVHTVTDGG